MSKLQLTLAILKPDISVQEKTVSAVRHMLIENNFLFVRSKFTKLSLDQAKEFYKVHHARFFYNRLIYSMSSGPIWCHVLARQDAISKWRAMLGPTKVFKTIYDQPESIRGLYGTTDTRNAAHGSDSDLSARQEIKFFFPEFDYDEWFDKEEAIYRTGPTTFDTKTIQHFADTKSQT